MKKRNLSIIEDKSSDDSLNNKNKNTLNKDKLIELQIQNYSDIRTFIIS